MIDGKILNLQQILAAKDSEIERVACPEWGGSVCMRSMSGDDRDRIDARFAGHGGDPKKLKGMRAAVVAACLCDESGNLLIAPDAPEQARKDLGARSGKVLDRLFAVAQRVSGLTETDVKALEKNSQPSVDSGSGSP